MKIQFFGATQVVTGSCFLITCGDQHILVECGLIQGGHMEEAHNFEPFPFSIADIDAVVLTHAHLDHSGQLPKLVRDGYDGPIYTHCATRDLCQIMLMDAAVIHEKDTEIFNRKRARKHLPLLTPLYTEQDVDATMPKFKTLRYQEKITIANGVSIRLQDAGHILGSAILEMWLTENNVTKKIVFSGDLGHPGAPILKNPTVITEADWIVMESTYGDRNHRSWESTYAELGEAFASADRDHGNILIPAFTIGRTQELLCIFKQHLKEWNLDKWKIFLDSPMAIAATGVYAKHSDEYDEETKAYMTKLGSPFSLPNLHMSRDVADSIAINHINSGAIIIAGNGMCSGGRILHHLKYNVWRPNCHILLVGFQARGTIGRALVEGAKSIILYGERIRVAAKIHTIGGLSAHADQANLLQWLRSFHGKPNLVLVHGEKNAMDALAERSRKELNWVVREPAYSETIELDHE